MHLTKYIRETAGDMSVTLVKKCEQHDKNAGDMLVT